MPLAYETVVQPPLDDAALVFMVEKVREVAWPRLHVTVEAESRRELRRKLDDLNLELRTRDCPALAVADFTKGRAL